MTEKKKDNRPKERTISDIIGGTEFYPELPKAELKEILDKQYLLIDSMIVKDYTSKFGTHDFILLLLGNTEDGSQFTTITSGEVVIKRVRELKEADGLPCLATISYNGTYYNIL